MSDLYLGRSETGRCLIGMIKHEIELMHTLKSPQDGDRSHCRFGMVPFYLIMQEKSMAGSSE